MLLAVARVAPHEYARRHLTRVEHGALDGALGLAPGEDVQERGFAAARGSEQGGERAGLQKAADVFQERDDLAAAQRALGEAEADILVWTCGT